MTTPAFALNAYGFWTATVTLPDWAGYLDRGGAYGGPGRDGTSDGSVSLVFAPEGRDRSPLTPAELALADWLVAHQHDVAAAVKSAIVRHYPAIRQLYREAGLLDEVDLPALSSPDDLRRLIGLYAVNVHQLSKGGVPYLGFEFGCTWDDEHGLGVLAHGTRVVEVGASDAARLLWIAERDADPARTR